MKKKRAGKCSESVITEKNADGRGFMHRWLDALCRGESGKRRIALHSTGPFRESLSFANRPLKLGERLFDSGLAFLTDGSIEVSSDIPMTRFRATAGLDNNSIANRMVLTSVVFSVESEGRELWRSLPAGPDDGPQQIDLTLDGVKRLMLKAVMVSESARALRGYLAHADYAQAEVELSDGSVHRVARTLEERRLEEAVRPPVSFRIGGRDSDEFFDNCLRRSTVEALPGGERRYTIDFANDATGVTCRIEARQFADFSAVEWTAHFLNHADADSPLIEDVRALDIAWPAPAPAWLHCGRGSDERPDDFQYIIEELGTIRSDLRTISIDSGSEGRSSVSWLPFMNMQTANEGLVIAIGWSGQWSAEIGREAKTGAMRLKAGMDGISLRLHPGEIIRTPRILLMDWKGEPAEGNNLLRRYMLKHCVPQFDGKPVEAPSCLCTWGGQTTPEHLDFIRQLGEKNLKYDCYWVDAGWYGTSEAPCPDVFNGEWWKVGDWRIHLNYHKNGLKDLSGAVHNSGMKLMLWVEPERALHGVPVTLEHPEWFLAKNRGPREEGENLLLDLGNPDGLNYAIETVARLLGEEGVDWYRQDFNMSPLEYWKNNDAPDRQGIAQIRHIEGLYAFWDELRLRFPRLVIDNCASGGRRIDMETMSRSIPLWRSDYNCFDEANPDGLQVHGAGISCWVPISSGGNKFAPGDTYSFRSNLSPALVEGALKAANFNEKDRPETKRLLQWHRKMVADHLRARPLFYGDFYPLTSITVLPDAWLAYQLHRPESGDGMIVAFRRARSAHSSGVFRLKGLEPDRRYCFEDADSGQKRVFPGGRLEKTGVKIELPEPRSSCILFYNKANS